VAEVRAQQLRLGDDWRDFDAVVLAAELPQASQLVPEIGAAAAPRVWLKMGYLYPPKWIKMEILVRK
jgi:hypothetical protein